MDIDHVILITADSFRVKNLGCYGYSKPTTPNIDALAAKGILFENVFACANNSDSSLMSIFSGKYPRSHGIISHGSRIREEDLRKAPKTVLLPELLKTHGYTTCALSVLGTPRRPMTKWHKRGFDSYYDEYLGSRRLVEPPEAVARSINDLFKRLRLQKLFMRMKGMGGVLGVKGFNARTVTDIAIRFTRENRNRKSFIFLDYIDAHSPYLPPPAYSERFYGKGSISDPIDKERFREICSKKWVPPYFKTWLMNSPSLEYLLAQYDGVIAFVDYEIGRLMRVVEEEGLAERTLIVFTADHGESLLEHGIYFDHHGLYDVSIHTPLILKYPGCLGGKRVKSFIQHVDLLPTVMDILGIPRREELDGVSLIPLIDGGMEDRLTGLRSAVYSEEGCTEWKMAIRTERYKYIHAPSEAAAVCRYCGRLHVGLRELYDLRNDPEETRNIVDEEPEVADELRDRLFRWVSSFKRVHYPIYLYQL